jgi:hypothetical protein
MRVDQLNRYILDSFVSLEEYCNPLEESVINTRQPTEKEGSERTTHCSLTEHMRIYVTGICYQHTALKVCSKRKSQSSSKMESVQKLRCQDDTSQETSKRNGIRERKICRSEPR